MCSSIRSELPLSLASTVPHCEVCCTLDTLVLLCGPPPPPFHTECVTRGRALHAHVDATQDVSGAPKILQARFTRDAVPFQAGFTQGAS